MEEKVREFLKTARRKRDFEIEYDSIEEALRKLKLLRDGRLTNACVLIFAKDPQTFSCKMRLNVAGLREQQPRNSSIWMNFQVLSTSR